MITYDQAKKYLDYGLSIFPVYISQRGGGKFNKRPAVPWKEYQTRLPYDEELHEWFDDPGLYNGIGAVTGKISGVVVLDVESDAKPEHVKDLRSRLTSRTISGGYHHFYRWQRELRNTVKIRGMSVDFRGDGGYVVLPPSGSGEFKYEWVNKCEKERLTNLPQIIEMELSGKYSSVTSSDRREGLLTLDSGFPIANVGERNSTATTVAGILINMVDQGGWELVGWPQLRLWNSQNPDPLPEDELRRTWESVRRTHLRKHPDGGKDKPGGEPERNPIIIHKGGQAKKVWEKLEQEYGQGVTTGFEEVDDFFHFLPGHVYMLSARTHVGKTAFALNMAGRMASMNNKVLFASLEQGVFVVPRIESMIRGNLPESLYILESTTMPTIDQLIESSHNMPEKMDLICIDHLHFIKREGKGGVEDVDQMILDIQRLSKQLEMPVLVIAHVKKLNADRAPTMDDLRDSSMLSQVPSVVMFLHRKEATEDMLINGFLENKGQLIVAKNRVTGKTGMLQYDLLPTGEMRFEPKVRMYAPTKPVPTATKPVELDDNDLF